MRTSAHQHGLVVLEPSKCRSVPSAERPRSKGIWSSRRAWVFRGSYELTRDQFVAAMEAEMNERGVQSDPVTLGALFSVFDRNASGRLDFREFTVGFARLTTGRCDCTLSTRRTAAPVVLCVLTRIVSFPSHASSIEDKISLMFGALRPPAVLPQVAWYSRA